MCVSPKTRQEQEDHETLHTRGDRLVLNCDFGSRWTLFREKNLASGSYICCQQFAGGNTLAYEYALQLPRCRAMIVRCRFCARCGQVRCMKQRFWCAWWQCNAERKDNAQDGRDQVKKERGCTGCRFRSPCWEYGGLVCETWASMFMVVVRECTNRI